MNDKVIIFPDESYVINGACMEVYKTLGMDFSKQSTRKVLRLSLGDA
jgi:hypothetical protein